jgi:selenocysteine-specific elongation factor
LSDSNSSSAQNRAPLNLIDQQRAVVIGTAGHVDHGKTALVRALTGVDTDRLPEERARGISIDLGYAPLAISESVAMSVVDVPGHERFVRRMVAGATGVDMYLLVVACTEGVMPQTREHLLVLDLLGIRRGICVLTKRDLVDDDMAALARLDVDELLDGRDVPVVEVSSRTGSGLDRLRGLLVEVAEGATPEARELPARLWVDRVFTLPGHGTIATGTLWSGTIRVGDKLVAHSRDEALRVRSIQVHNRDTAEVTAGRRVAVGLSGVSPRDLRRGIALCEPSTFPVSYRLDVQLEGFDVESSPSLVRVHHGTGEQTARLVLAGDGFAQLRLTAPVNAFRGDRVVLRWDGRTLGGATVVDPRPPRRIDADRIRGFALGSPVEIVEALLTEAGRPVGRDHLRSRGLLTEAELDEGLSMLVRLDTEYTTRSWFDETAARVREGIEQLVAEFPLDPGLPLEFVGPPGRWRDAFVAQLPYERRGSKLYAPGAAAQLEQYAAVIARMLEAIAEAGFSPTPLERLAAISADELRALSEVLEQSGEIVRVRSGLVMAAAAYEEARARLVEACEREGRISLGGYRDILGTSRRTADILLQHFDAIGVTRRIGDDRVIGRRARGSEASSTL